MKRFVLSPSRFRSQVLGCWLGKNVGGTLGAPYEGQKHVHSLSFYEPVPKKAAPNDDLDLQLVWLKMLEDSGPDPALPRFAEYWTRYAAAYPWNEYGFAHRNLARGLAPPVSGAFENYFVDEMGSPIRSEIWAATAPADPELAASFAWKDSAVDHAGGEGTCGEMFWAAVESAAFVESDPMALIGIGLAMIPMSSQISRVIREAVWCREKGLLWAEARERVASRFGHLQPCNAVPNHGFTIIGWLWGGDFGDRLCKAVNCGYDTDCTGATLGSVLGILGGAEAIPEKWLAPVGREIVLHKFTGDCGAPKDVDELTERTIALARLTLARCSEVAAMGGTDSSDGGHSLPDDALTLLRRNARAREALRQEPDSAVALDERGSGVEVTLHYMGDPVLRPAVGRALEVSVREAGREREADVSLSGPGGWEVEAVEPRARPHARARFVVRAGDVPARNTLRVTASVAGREVAASFAILGPDEAKGFPAGANVENCPKCHARKEACICPGA